MHVMRNAAGPNFEYLDLLGQLAEGGDVGGLADLQHGVYVCDAGLLQLLADARQVGAAAAPEGELLQGAGGVARLHRLLGVQHLLDLTRPVDHHH